MYEPDFLRVGDRWWLENGRDPYAIEKYDNGVEQGYRLILVSSQFIAKSKPPNIVFKTLDQAKAQYLLLI